MKGKVFVKKILAAALCAVMVLFNFAAVVGAEEPEKTANYDEISVKFYDRYLDLDTCPVIRNGHTLVPLKAIIVGDSVVVSWSINADGEIDVTKPVKICTYELDSEWKKWWLNYGDDLVCKLKIEIPVGENYMYVSEEKVEFDYAAEVVNKYVDGERVELECAAEVVNGTVMVPVRPIAEAMGFKVEWDDETRSVLITR